VTFGPAGLYLPESSGGSPEQVALALFESYPLLFGTGDVGSQLRVVRTRRDPGPPNLTHVELQQIYAGIPMYGGRLVVHLTPAMTVSSVSGNYVRDARVVPVASISEDQARHTAVMAVAEMRMQGGSKGGPVSTKRRGPLASNDSKTVTVVTDTGAEVRRNGLCVLPAALGAGEGNPNYLAYQFSFVEADLFVDARAGDIVMAISNQHSTERLVFNANGQGPGVFLPGTRLFRNGIPDPVAPGTVLSPEQLDATRIMNDTLGFFSGLGRTSFDDRDSALLAFTNSIPGNAFWDSFRRVLWFGPGFAVDDVLAHEFTHGITKTTAGLIYLDESGALNEHYSDVFGALVFPEVPGTWRIGEATLSVAAGGTAPVSAPGGGILRIMTNAANYATYRQRGPACSGMFDVLTGPCDNGFVHTNSNIGNKAATLIADGDGGMNPGIGRARLARLFFDTLTTRMHPWSTYLDELHNTWETARNLQGVQITDLAAPSGRSTFLTTDRDRVSWAFTQVGVDARLQSGWFSVGGSLDPTILTFYADETMPAGFTVADVILIVRTT